ncbi:MAG: VOC family protein [Pseudomonadota bacterium]
MTTHRAMPILEVRDVAAATNFYARLGFADHGPWLDGGVPKFTIVQRGDVTLGLTHAESPAKNAWWAAYIYVSDAKTLRAEFTADGLAPTDMHRPKDYGCIDFDIIDPDGHRIAFGQALNPVPGPGLGDNRGKG